MPQPTTTQPDPVAEELQTALLALERMSTKRLSDSESAAARWVGKGALKELTSAAVQGKLAGRRRSPSRSRIAK